VLAPAAAGLALAVGLGLSAIEHDVRGRSWRFGLRRLVAAGGLLALCAATTATVVASTDGWWNMPRDDFASLVGFADEDVRADPGRVLWVGDDELIPGADGWPLGADLAYTAATVQAVPGVADLWPATSDGASERLGDALQLALDHDTTRLGRELAPMAVRYIAIPRRLAPGDDRARTSPAQQAADRAADELAGALAEQLDLEHVRLDTGIVLYRNTAALPLRSAFPDGVGEDALDDARPVLDDGGARSASGPVRRGDTVVQASTASEHWRLEVDGVTAEHGEAFGWADAFTIDGSGDARLDYRTPAAARALLAAQVVGWLLALALALRMRFGPGDRAGPARTPPAPAEAGPPTDPAPPERVLVGQASGS
jgi:hypothetical protein